MQSTFDEKNRILKYKEAFMDKVYCKYCGRDYPDECALPANNCQRHPDGRGKRV